MWSSALALVRSSQTVDLRPQPLVPGLHPRSKNILTGTREYFGSQNQRMSLACHLGCAFNNPYKCTHPWTCMLVFSQSAKNSCPRRAHPKTNLRPEQELRKRENQNENWTPSSKTLWWEDVLLKWIDYICVWLTNMNPVEWVQCFWIVTFSPLW